MKRNEQARIEEGRKGQFGQEQNTETKLRGVDLSYGHLGPWEVLER